MMMILMHLVAISVNEEFSSRALKLLGKFGFNFKPCNGSTISDSTLEDDSTVTPETEIKILEASIEQEHSEKPVNKERDPLEETREKIADKSFQESNISPGSSEESCIIVFCEIWRKCNQEGSSANSSESDPVVTQQLLMQAGDVESNPGPTESELTMAMYIDSTVFFFGVSTRNVSSGQLWESTAMAFKCAVNNNLKWS